MYIESSAFGLSKVIIIKDPRLVYRKFRARLIYEVSTLCNDITVWSISFFRLLCFALFLAIPRKMLLWYRNCHRSSSKQRQCYQCEGIRHHRYPVFTHFWKMYPKMTIFIEKSTLAHKNTYNRVKMSVHSTDDLCALRANFQIFLLTCYPE